MGKDVLTFGPLIRVSTEPQKVRGESLRVQRAQIETAMKALGGKVQDWYGGQEHATPGWERKELDRLMQAAMSGQVNAIMVADASRWSRDNLKSAQYIEVLKEHDVRFFILTSEKDLFNPEDMFALGVQVHSGQFHQDMLAKKSHLSRIARAERNIPCAGKLPFGRTYDKKKQEWGVVPELKKKVGEMARLYLSGYSFADLGEHFKMNGPYLRNILLFNSGDKWTIDFNSKKFKIAKKVTLTIPPLLDDATIAKLRAKSEARRLWEHGKLVHEYLLARMIFDGPTGRALTGTATPRARYYRSFKGASRYSIAAGEIEARVLADIFSIIADDKAFRRAIFEGSKTAKVADDLRAQREVYEKELTLATKRLDQYAAAIGNYAGKDIGGFLGTLEGKIKEAEGLKRTAQEHLDGISKQLASLPTEADLKQLHGQLQGYARFFIKGTKKLNWKKHSKEIRVWMAEDLMRGHRQALEHHELTTGTAFNALPLTEKRRFLGLVIGGKDAEGKRYGVYVWPGEIKRHKRPFRYEIHGRLGNLEGWMDAGVNILKAGVKLESHGQCNAHHCIGLHQR
jgi:DNA invertase Pin-like site-specific DNA recombinase